MAIDMHKPTNKLNNDNDHSPADPGSPPPPPGAVKLMTKTGIQGACRGKFSIFELNLVHTFYQH